MRAFLFSAAITLALSGIFVGLIGLSTLFAQWIVIPLVNYIGRHPVPPTAWACVMCGAAIVLIGCGVGLAHLLDPEG